MRLIDPDGKQTLPLAIAAEVVEIGIGIAATVCFTNDIVDIYQQSKEVANSNISNTALGESNSIQNIRSEDIAIRQLQNKAKGIESHLTNIDRHLKKWDKQFPSPNLPDPHNWKVGWTTTIITALNNIAKKVSQLDKNSVNDLLGKFDKWNKEDIIDLMNRVMEKGIDPSKYIKF